MRTARLLTLFALVCSAAALFGKDRNWQDATVEDARTGSAGSMAVGSVTGTGSGASGWSVAGAIIVTYYSIRAGDMLYIVGCVPRGTVRYRCPDLTVHGKTRIAIEGRDAHILDDEGKDRKLPIIEKILEQSKEAKP